MTSDLIISDDELASYLVGDNMADKAHALLCQQKESWGMLRAGYEALASVQTRLFMFNGNELRVQFNPGRLTSSAAKVDDKSIKERKCFLCLENLPEAQRGLYLRKEYVALCNPFPIFPEHFTISNKRHIPQRILSSFPEFLQITKELSSRYTVFYNGPRCGASAPDHLHFQAGLKDFMPLDHEYPRIRDERGVRLCGDANLSVFTVRDFQRKMFAFESREESRLVDAFELFYQAFSEVVSDGDEPMMNILASFENGCWRVLIFPREVHRPSFFFAEDENNILISPAAVDLGGVCITPLEKDFVKISRDGLALMFEEITLSPAKVDELTDRLSRSLGA